MQLWISEKSIRFVKKRDEVKEMKNKEKFAKEIVEIACYGDYFGMDKRTGEITSCDYIPCRNCMFNDGMNCNKTRKDWAEQEYIEKPVISKRDRVFLDCIKARWKYMARDNISSTVYAFFGNSKEKQMRIFYLHGRNKKNFY